MSLKLDMSKAYERIEWKFLEKMMIALGFDSCWVEKVMMCVESVKYRVKINDNISDIIKPRRGLRQGDPISSYLFLICAEWLTHTIRMYQELGLIEGIKICKGAPVVLHLMLADDCMIFLKARQDSVGWIKDVLRRYEAVSGLKINYSKSEGVCSSNVKEDFRKMAREGLQIKLVEAHSDYLGLPMLFSNRKAALFRAIEEKAVRKISDWKHRLLSGAGREVLIKLVLQSIPIYAMSCYKIHLSICKKLAGDIIRFWWHEVKNRGIHWLRAAKLYEEKQFGGLGFKNIELMNLALLAKQGWRIMTTPELLVSKIFKAKYFPSSDIFNASGGTRPSYAWRGILESLEILKYGAEWNEDKNRYYRRLDGSGTFTVRSAYLVALKLERQKNTYMAEQSDTKETQRFWKNFWKLEIPNKIKTFGWRLFHDGLPTMNNLLRRGCLVENACRHCGFQTEDALHLFRDCWWVKSVLQEVNLPGEVWNNQCDDPDYWIWLCAKLCLKGRLQGLNMRTVADMERQK
ncbi:unnamed protein product [Rhodiola kirilowii]